MTGHIGSPVLADSALYDQLRACHTEISEYMASRASVPLSTDRAAVLHDYADALIDVYGILSRVNVIFLQLEMANG